MAEAAAVAQCLVEEQIVRNSAKFTNRADFEQKPYEAARGRLQYLDGAWNRYLQNRPAKLAAA